MLLATPGVAQAGFTPALPVDGPSADVVGAGDVALALDGAGAVTYLKLDGGVAHVFVADLTRGVPGPPRRADLGQDAPSSQPRIAVTNGGRVLVTWLNDGKLFASLRPSRNALYSPPLVAYAPPAGSVQDSSLSMAVSGKAYAGVATSGGDVRAAYMTADGAWSAPDPPLDVDPAQTATSPAVAASADGTALYAWTETGGDGFTHVFARRVVGTHPSSVAPEASVPALEGRAGGNADSPSVGIEYDSARAWVAFRQEFSDGAGFTSRAFGRRLLASAFDDPPVPVDGLAFGVGASAMQPRLAFTGRGRGTFAAALHGPARVSGVLLKNDVLGVPRLLGDGTSLAESFPAPTASEDGTGTVSWQRDPGAGGVPSIVGRHLSATGLEPDVALSVPALGPVDASSGLRASGDAGGDAAITFAQGDASARSVVVALYDAPPGHPHAHNEKRWRREPRPRFHWSTVQDAWTTTVKYRLEIDRAAVRTSAGTTYVPRVPIPDGDHRWRIVTIDGRGQETISHDRFLRIDTRKPKLRVRTSRRGTLVTFRVLVDDGPAGSGAARIAIGFGDGTHGQAPPRTGTIAHRYAAGGSYPIVVTVRDKAGNEASVSARARAG
ncbi:MAG: hypothetical protein QOE38_1673 [Thermoleophilaceae bacterium]|nr:hypothetical protein [Thermoleophilaceae bacterium]